MRCLANYVGLRPEIEELRIGVSLRADLIILKQQAAREADKARWTVVYSTYYTQVPTRLSGVKGHESPWEVRAESDWLMYRVLYHFQ